MKTIPIVVHVVWNTPEQNISDAQIQSQINVLNQDFSRTNPDASRTPSAFAQVASDTGIRFCLVKIIRIKTNTTLFSDTNAVKFCHSGGSDALDTTKYMNVWVCNLGERLLGYGEFPNTKVSQTYGVVVNYGAFGTIGTARAPYDKGRTLTHEISHCLSIYHVFHEPTDSTSCKKTDHCADIPAQSHASSGCPVFPKTDDCSLNPPGIMFMNYMDYTDDSCMNMFTKDQAARMNATLNISPYNTLGLARCNPIIQTISCDASKVVPNSTQLISNSIFTFKNIVIAILVMVIIYGIFRSTQTE